MTYPQNTAPKLARPTALAPKVGHWRTTPLAMVAPRGASQPPIIEAMLRQTVNDSARATYRDASHGTPCRALKQASRPNSPVALIATRQ